MMGCEHRAIQRLANLFALIQKSTMPSDVGADSQEAWKLNGEFIINYEKAVDGGGVWGKICPRALVIVEK